MEIGDRWSHLWRPVEPLKMVKMLEFSKILKFEKHYFWCNGIFCQTKIFETYTIDEVDEAARVSAYDAFRLCTSQNGCTPLIFEHFPKSNIFDIFDFPRKLTIGPNDLGETRESLSRLDLSIPHLDIPPTHAGNCTFCVKNRDFSNISRNSHL